MPSMVSSGLKYREMWAVHGTMHSLGFPNLQLRGPAVPWAASQEVTRRVREGDDSALSSHGTLPRVQ